MGETILNGLFDTIDSGRCSCFLLSAMSAKGNLIDKNYTSKTIAMAKKYPEYVSGFIGFASVPEDLKSIKKQIPNDMLLLMPGINLEYKGDDLGQQYVTVDQAIKNGADLIIVGRGILKSNNPQKTADLYKNKAWNALLEANRV